jgi:hypothetical protein
LGRKKESEGIMGLKEKKEPVLGQGEGTGRQENEEDAGRMSLICLI